MKKICFIDYNFSIIGGVEQVTASLVNALADFYEVHLISIFSDKEPAYKLDNRVKYTLISTTEYPRLRERRKGYKQPLTDYINSNNIDVVFSQGTGVGYIASALRFSVKAKLVFNDHGALINEWNDKDIVLMRLFSILLHHKTVTLTKQNLASYRKRFFIPKRKLTVIPNWISDNIPISEKYDINSKRIISAGRFGKEKGFDMLVKAFAPVAEKHPDWHLDIYGDGEMMDTVKNLIVEYDIGNNVHLMGMCSNLAEKYREYSMYVLPSYREGLPLVLLESKANRLPIVSFDITTGPREIVRNVVDGILVPPYDLAQMGDAICRLIEDTDLRISMSQRSQENVEKFSKTTILKQWCDLIESF